MATTVLDSMENLLVDKAKRFQINNLIPSF